MQSFPVEGTLSAERALPGAFYGVSARGCLWSDPTGSSQAMAVPEIVDLRTGNAAATMNMMLLH